MRFFSLSTIVILLIGGCSSISNNKHKNTVYVPKNVEIIHPTLTPTPVIENIVEKAVISNNIVVPENKELKKSMRNLDYILFSRVNSEVEEGEEGMFFTKNTQKLLKDVINDSNRIKLLYPNPDDEYMRLAIELEKEAIKLYKIAKVKKMEWIKPQLDNIIDICNQCHYLYSI
jgi:hypothetical protein